MSERNEIRDEGSATPVAEMAPPIVSDAPAIAPVAQPEEAKADAKAPPAAPLPQSTPAAEPPPFLREHQTRVVTTRATAKPAKAKPAAATAAAAAANDKPRSKFPLLAATLALAAAVGGAAGALGVPAAINMAFGATTAAPAGETTDVQALKTIAAQLSSDIAALRAATEQSSKTATTQFSKISERLERAERAQAEPSAKIAKIGEAVERLEKRAAAPTPPHGDVTGSVPPPEAKPKPVILEDYVVRKVFDGVALVEGRRGIIEVEPGATLPGAGRVEEIRRQDGRWVVVTSKGLIAPPR